MQTEISQEIYDVLIVGAGPVGIACALELKKKNLSYVVIEKGTLVNSLYNYPTNMTYFSTSNKLEIDNIPFISIKPKPNKEEALEYYRRVAELHKLDIRLFEKVEQIEKDNVFKVKTSKANYKAKKIIVSTGFFDIPNYIGVKGEDLQKVFHYYNNPHFFTEQKVIVVGASNSAVDAALETYRKGAEVTMIVREPEIGERVKYWVRPDIENRIEEGSIKAFFNSNILEIREDEVDVLVEGKEKITLKNDFVIAMTGYRPDFDFLEHLGIEFSEDGWKKPIYNPETMETNVQDIYLAGVVCGGLETHKWFIENSLIHSTIIAEHLSKIIN